MVPGRSGDWEYPQWLHPYFRVTFNELESTYRLTPIVPDADRGLTRRMVSGPKLRARRKDGSHFPVEISLKEMETWRAGTPARSN